MTVKAEPQLCREKSSGHRTGEFGRMKENTGRTHLVWNERETYSGRNSTTGSWEGSYTVEAAMVFPIVLFVLAALIICAFYVHDRAVSQSIVCEMASAGSNFITEAERQEAMDAVKKQATASRFLGSRNLSLRSSSGKTEANAALSAEYPVPGMVMKYFAGGSLAIQKKWSSKTPDPAKAIWIMRGLKRLIDGGIK